MNYLYYSHIENYGRMPLRKLKELRDCIEGIIEGIEASPERREIDIAVEHSGEAELVHTVYRNRGSKNRGIWYQVQTIYCSLDRCPNCPHGPYSYTYRRNKKRGTLSVTFRGKPVFHPEFIEKLMQQVKPPIAAYEFRFNSMLD